MGSSPKPPKQTDSQRRAEAMQTKLLEQQLKDAKKPANVPKLDIPQPKPMPPPQVSEDVGAAASEAKKRAMRRTNAGRGTLLAGETQGSYAQKSTLLG